MVEAMNDDDRDLKRLFADAPVGPADAAFVARVETTIARRRRVSIAVTAGAAALTAFLVWATWPVADQLAAWMLDSLLFLGPFFATFDGHLVIVALLATAGAWLWLHEKLGNAYD
jgi:hypothetical protein